MCLFLAVLCFCVCDAPCVCVCRETLCFFSSFCGYTRVFGFVLSCFCVCVVCVLGVRGCERCYRVRSSGGGGHILCSGDVCVWGPPFPMVCVLPCVYIVLRGARGGVTSLCPFGKRSLLIFSVSGRARGGAPFVLYVFLWRSVGCARVGCYCCVREGFYVVVSCGAGRVTFCVYVGGLFSGSIFLCVRYCARVVWGRGEEPLCGGCDISCDRVCIRGVGGGFVWCVCVFFVLCVRVLFCVAVFRVWGRCGDRVFLWGFFFVCIAATRCSLSVRVLGFVSLSVGARPLCF
ncbi:hypothetical protein P800_01142 [Acinetobacter lwoffii NCTC 5866 = CIP 64.10 = NIPH 512]|uniref:Uncharacterized protein n=1 Tax=Acinetobacter lwoffii NCTC 5866 = CIP 64.10 = NIPH 512 TaxID=981327 RepID=A0ABN0Q0I2_ACILW|nr:hypothetical protein P800_01142 [Acinetobacter lwoffii NCTC 5866 = CIP 64.10 = NIPH 512]